MGSFSLSLPGFALCVPVLSRSHPAWSHICMLLGVKPSSALSVPGANPASVPRTCCSRAQAAAAPAAASAVFAPRHPRQSTPGASQLIHLKAAEKCNSCSEEMTVSVSTASYKFLSAGTQAKNVPKVRAAVQETVQRVVGTPLGCTLYSMLIKPSFH